MEDFVVYQGESDSLYVWEVPVWNSVGTIFSAQEILGISEETFLYRIFP
jgi:hypothetical protein